MKSLKNGRIWDYLKPVKATLLIVTISGIIYNVGMTAGPWFEGKLAQCLCDIIGNVKDFRDMVKLALTYVAVILSVQTMRYIKRLYVRKFANHINRDMKEDLYHSMVLKSKGELEQEGVGSLMTKAIADVDTCVEGIRKFTTEVFDTGVVMIAYFVMLLGYDWRLTLLSMFFPPIAYYIANRLKKTVTQSAKEYKGSAGLLNGATYDRIGNALTYRIYGQESMRDSIYEKCLMDYEVKAIRANIWENVMQPIYQVISMAGCLCILWFGGKNVLGQGWTQWDIAAFVTYLSCFTKLASKSSKAAKLFNSVQKASVSWKRIQPLLKSDNHSKTESKTNHEKMVPNRPMLSVDHLSFHYEGSPNLFSDLSFSANQGEIIGITGPIACGKTTLGKVFLGEFAYEGEIHIQGKATYMGHESELISGTIEENILMGDSGDVWKALSWVQMDEEVKQLPNKIHTRIGNGGITLSGGQQARIALARTLWHCKEVLILDDPFSAVDMQTEKKIFAALQELAQNKIVLLFSHRLSLFPQMSQVIWMENGKVTVSNHEKLMKENPEYSNLYQTQTQGSREGKGEVGDEE